MPKQYRIMQVRPVEEQQFNSPPPPPPRPGEFPYMVQAIESFIGFKYWKDEFAASTLESAKTYIKRQHEDQQRTHFTPVVVS